MLLIILNKHLGRKHIKFDMAMPPNIDSSKNMRGDVSLETVYHWIDVIISIPANVNHGMIEGFYLDANENRSVFSGINHVLGVILLCICILVRECNK